LVLEDGDRINNTHFTFSYRRKYCSNWIEVEQWNVSLQKVGLNQDVKIMFCRITMDCLMILSSHWSKKTMFAYSLVSLSWNIMTKKADNRQLLATSFSLDHS